MKRLFQTCAWFIYLGLARGYQLQHKVENDINYIKNCNLCEQQLSRLLPICEHMKSLTFISFHDVCFYFFLGLFCSFLLLSVRPPVRPSARPSV